MTLRDISPEEWVSVRKSRATKMTGYPCFSIKEGNITSWYIWSWGKQPEGILKRKLIAGCPIKAANNFLKLFLKNKTIDSAYIDTYRSPDPRY